MGAGAGRHALPLQESGREVVALDVSPGGVEVCRRRGVRETFTGTVFELAETGPEPFLREQLWAIGESGAWPQFPRNPGGHGCLGC